MEGVALRRTVGAESDRLQIDGFQTWGCEEARRISLKPWPILISTLRTTRKIRKFPAPYKVDFIFFLTIIGGHVNIRFSIEFTSERLN
jgi:hypothetical protein